MLVGACITFSGGRMLISRQLGVSSLGQWIVPIVLLVVGLGLLGSGFLRARSIEKGTKKNHYEKLRLESEARMLDSNYVNRLKELGYHMMDRKK